MRSMRYAIYYLPQSDSPLWTFGASVLGYDSIRGTECPHLYLPETSGLDLLPLTHEPRDYGFHATLKAPFFLMSDAEESELLDAVSIFAEAEAPLDIGPLTISDIGSFLALIAQSSKPLQNFAGRCVVSVDNLRASMTAIEREKRLRAPLTERQTALLDTWGYPYVFEEFRFHLTLTSSLDADIRNRLKFALESEYRRISESVILDSICVCAQPKGERFRLLKRFRLGSAQ